MNAKQSDQTHAWRPFTQEKSASEQIHIIRGKGAYLYGADGKKYLDMISSWWANLHGHSHPKIAEAITKQVHELEHVMFADFTHEPAIRFSKALGALLPGDLNKVFFSDNGSTAVETALKMAIQYWYNLREPRTEFIAFERGYHGDTFGAMSVGKGCGFYKPFEKCLFDTELVPFPATWWDDNCVEQKEALTLSKVMTCLNKHKNKIAGLIIEPLIQGAGGINVCRTEFLQKLVALCKANDVLVIFDEVMTGFGRTGDMFACIKSGVVPDIICLSKGISGGFLPFAATVTTNRIYDLFLSEDGTKTFMHGHTYTANPLGCAAANASLAVFEEDKTFEKIRKMEEVHCLRISGIAKKFYIVKRPRVIGTIAAFEVGNTGEYGNKFSQILKNKFLSLGIFIRPLGNVVYLMPPYCVNESELHHAYDIIESVLALEL